ncbi:TRAP transporter small permease [Thermodesulfobacteriota bacterium]
MKKINLIVRIAGLISMGVLFLMMLLTVADVFMRAVLNKPIIGTTEITEQMMVVIVFLGLGWCALQGKQIRVDLFVTRYPAGMLRIIDTIVYSVGLILVAVICWRTFMATLTVHDLGLTCAYIGVPKFPFYGLATFGWGVLFVSMISILVKRIKDGAES